jgi:hypothetical protein
MEKSDKFRWEPAKGGEFGSVNANYGYEKRAPSEISWKASESLRKATGRLKENLGYV